MTYKRTKKNKERAASVKDLVERFQVQQGLKGEETETILCDLLCNLMHYAAQNKTDFGEAVIRGTYHFKEEAANIE